MAKKKLQPTAPVMTRGQLSRAARERQQVQRLYATGVAVLTLVALVLGFAVFSTVVLQPNAEVATVNGVKINRATYNKVRRWNLFQQNNQTSAQQLAGGSTTLNSTASTVSLTSVDGELLDSSTVSQLVDGEVLRQKSKSDLQISPSEADLKAEAVKGFVPQPTAPPSSETPTVESTSSITPTVTRTFTPGPPTQTPTSTPTLPPVPGAQQTAEASYSSFVKAIANGPKPSTSTGYCSQGCPGLSENDYLTLIIGPSYLQQKVTDKLATGVVTQVEQIHAQHILTDTQDGAKKIIDMLNKGADFTKLANEQSSEQLQNTNPATRTGGDLGWFPQKGSNYDQTFVDAAFKVPAGQYTKDPVHTSFGYHVIKVLERDPKRALTQTQIDSAKSQAYQDWFTKAKQGSTIHTALPLPTVVPTQPAIIEPTQPPTAGSPTAQQSPAAQQTPPVGTPGGQTATPAPATPTAAKAGATPTK